MGSSARQIIMIPAYEVVSPCPVCGVDWTKTEDGYCKCDRPRESDAEEMAQAYLHASLARMAKAASDGVFGPLAATPARQGNVIPFRAAH